jgi:hypothetical protein
MQIEQTMRMGRGPGQAVPIVSRGYGMRQMEGGEYLGNYMFSLHRLTIHFLSFPIPSGPSHSSSMLYSIITMAVLIIVMIGSIVALCFGGSVSAGWSRTCSVWVNVCDERAKDHYFQGNIICVLLAVIFTIILLASILKPGLKPAPRPLYHIWCDSRTGLEEA